MLRVASRALACLIGLTTLASAADLAGRRPLPGGGFEPIFTWEGAYVGIVVGYGGATGTTRTFCTAPGPVVAGGGCPILPGLDVQGSGIVAGGGAGHNWQFGDYVAGIEADAAYTDIARNRAVASPFGLVGGGATPAGGAFAERQSIDFLSTIRGRVGYVFDDRLMVFASGGLAFGQVDRRQALVLPAAVFVARRNAIEPGWAAGAGVEYAFSDNVTAKAEALYVDLGRSSLIAGSTPPTGFLETTRFNTEAVILRAGVNYKFSPF